MRFDDRFEVRETLGRGGQGVVYRVFDRVDRREVAVKTLLRSSPEASRDLKREFRTVERIRHRNLVQLYELVVDERDAYFSMELVRGVDVVRWVRRDGAVDDDAVSSAFGQIVSGLQALHAAGQIHRDLKPPNVLVDGEGRVVILDFGLASLLDVDPISLQSAPDVAGTLLYMAPEALTGASPSEAWDVYGVGALLFEALTATPPFDADRARLFERKANPDALLDAAVLGRWRELVKRLLDPRPERRPSLAELAESFGAPAFAAAPPSVFIGRHDETTLLAEVWREGGLRVVLVSGDGGIGKSALVAQFAKSVRAEGALVFRSRCRPNESLPYEALDGLVDGLVRAIRQHGVVLDFDGNTAAPLAALFPGLRPVLPPADGPVWNGDGQRPANLRGDAARTFRRLLELVARVAPTLLWIDDAQWAGPDSATFFQTVLDGLEGECMVVVSHRPTDVPFVSLLRAHPTLDARTIDVAGLPDDAVADLISRRVDDDELRAVAAPWISAQSGGNPFFVLELCRSAAIERLDPNSTLADVFRRRFDALPEAERDLLSCVVVAGRAVERGLLIRCTDDPAADRVLGRLLDAGLLRDVPAPDSEVGTAFDVYHDRIRDVVKTGLPDDALRSANSRVADALLALEQPAGRLIEPLLGAARTAEAATYATVAAEESLQRLQFERAAQLFRLALEHGDHEDEARHELRRRLADALGNAGRGAASGDAWSLVADGGRDDGPEARRRAAALYLESGHIERGYEVLGRSLADFGYRLPKSVVGKLVGTLWARFLIFFYGVRLRPAREDARLRERVDVLWEVSKCLSMVDTVGGGAFQARNLFLALRLGDRYRLARALGIEAAYLAATGYYPTKRTEKVGALAERAGEEGGVPHGLAVGIGGYGVALYLEGSWRRGLEYCERADEIYRTRCRGVTWERDTTVLFIMMALLRLGRYDEVQERARDAMRDAIDRGDLFLQTYTSARILGPLLVARGEVDTAEKTVEDALRRWSPGGYSVEEYWADHARVMIALSRGDEAGARRLTEATARNLRDSFLFTLQEFRVEAACQAIRVDVLAALNTPGRSVARARRMIRTLLRAKVEWPRALGTALSGCVAAATGDRERAIAQLSDGERRLREVELLVDADVARWVLGDLRGDEEGAEMIEVARADLLARGVVAPDALARALYPTAGTRLEVTPESVVGRQVEGLDQLVDV